jgi:predicted metal-dependent phosphoesterase TrpH
MFKADLHTHSTYSDGTLSPAQLVLAARAAGLKGLALTDHDTVEGLPELLEEGGKRGLLAVGGVELSLNYSGTTHMLGYCMDKGLAAGLDLSFLQQFRQERNKAMFQRLLDLGLDLSWERVLEIGQDGQVGKPHLARAICEKGYASSLQDSFERYIGKGKPAYVDKKRLSAREGVRLLLDSGFAPVLAHPATLALPLDGHPKALKEMFDWGLVGVEAYHPDNSPELTDVLTETAKELGLACTNGSDFHGANKKTPLTWVMENSPLSVNIVEDLEKGLEDARRRAS